MNTINKKKVISGQIGTPKTYNSSITPSTTVAGVSSVNGKTGTVTLNAADIPYTGTKPDVQAKLDDLQEQVNHIDPTTHLKTINGESLVISDPSSSTNFGLVAYDKEQELTIVQMRQARENIDAYQLPGSGIPKQDLNPFVQNTLTKADAAICYLGESITDPNTQTVILKDTEEEITQPRIGYLVDYYRAEQGEEILEQWLFEGEVPFAGSWKLYRKIKNNSIATDADITQGKIHGLRTNYATNSEKTLNNRGYLDEIDTLISDDQTPQSVDYRIRTKIESLDVDEVTFPADQKGLANNAIASIKEEDGKIFVTSRTLNRNDFLEDNAFTEQQIEDLPEDLAEIKSDIEYVDVRHDEATKDYRIAIGVDADASGEAGSSATTRYQAVAIGRDAQATSASSVAIGAHAITEKVTAEDQCAVAIGYKAQANAMGAISIGSAAGMGTNSEQAALNGDHAIAIGRMSSATQEDSIAIGNAASATATNAIQIGTGTNTVANTAKIFDTPIIVNDQVPETSIQAYKNGFLEYVTLDGNQYIDTLTKLEAADFEFTIKLSFGATTTPIGVFGNRVAYNDKTFSGLLSNTSVSLLFDCGIAGTYRKTITPTEFPAEIIITRTGIAMSYTCNGGTAVSWNSDEVFATAQNIYLGTLNNNNSAFSPAFTGNLYGAKLVQNNVTKFDFHPCIQNGKVGLFDTVSRKVFYSIGSSDFGGSSLTPQNLYETLDYFNISKEDTQNKSLVVNNISTDIQYPTAKATYTAVNNEQVRAEGVEAQLRADLTTETADRIAADNALGSRIDTVLTTSYNRTAGKILKSIAKDSAADKFTITEETIQESDVNGLPADITRIDKRITDLDHTWEYSQGKIIDKIDIDTSASGGSSITITDRQLVQADVENLPGDLNTIRQSISDEVTARANADTALGNRIDGLNLTEQTFGNGKILSKISQTKGQLAVTQRDIARADFTSDFFSEDQVENLPEDLAARVLYDDVVDNVTTTTTDVPLSANQGKLLNDRIDHISSIGRFLALWDATTGLPETNPQTIPYDYRTGDYYRISKINSATPTDNLIPNGKQYTGVASTTHFVPSTGHDNLKLSDLYIYDGTTWTLVDGGSTGAVMDVYVGGTPVTSHGIAYVTNNTTQAELEVLHNSEISNADLVKLHAVTSTANELNQLAGSEVQKADLTKLHNVDASAAELSYTKGVTSGIQTQINNVAASIGAGVLTIQKNGVTLDTFSANDTEDKTVNIVADPLLPATTTTLGGVIVKDGLSVVTETAGGHTAGELSVQHATADVFGGVTVGANLKINTDTGKLDALPGIIASATAPAVGAGDYWLDTTEPGYDPSAMAAAITEHNLDTTAHPSKLNVSARGAANGVASLDSTGKVPVAQLPSMGGSVEGYYYNGKFYSDAAHTREITPESGKIYIDIPTNKTYRWDGTQYITIGTSLELGETSTTAYRGDKGKIAHDHSIHYGTSAPSDNDILFWMDLPSALLKYKDIDQTSPTYGQWIAANSLPASLNGTSDPTTSTVAKFVGQIYLNTTSGQSFICSAINSSNYTWLSMSTDISGKEDLSNKVKYTEGGITSSSTDSQYPSAKAVYEYVNSAIFTAMEASY